nr:MAG TPA: minor tail protein [Caudoviricetes sp.]
MAADDGTVFIPVLPDFNRFFDETSKGAKQAGERAGREFADAMESGVERAEKAQARAADTYEKAKNRAVAAAEKVTVQELKLAQAIEKHGNESVQAIEAENRRNQAIRESERLTRLSETAAKGLEKAERNVKKAIQEADDAVTLQTKNLSKFGGAVDGVESGGTRFKNLLTGIGTEAHGMGSRLDGVLGTVGKFGGLVAGGLGIAGGIGFFGDMITKGNELTQVMGSLQAVTGSNAETMELVSQRARQLGNDETLAGTSASSATDAMLALAKGGLSVQDSMDAAKGSIQLAGAAQVDAGQAADIQIAALNGFKLAATDAGMVADVLTNASNNSATGLVELGESLKYAAPTASTLGVSLQDTSTYLGLFANLGIKGSEAGTAMRSALLSLTSPSKEGAKALKEMGINAFDAQGKFVGMREITAQLASAQSRMGESAFTAAAATAFGREAVSFATTAATAGAEGFDQLRASLDRQGSAGETAGAKLSGLNGVMDRIGNAIEDLQLRIYELVAPHLAEWGESLSGIIGGLTDSLPIVIGLLSQFKDVFSVIGSAVLGAAAAMGVLKAAQLGLFAMQAATQFMAVMKALPALLAAQRAGTLAATAAQMGLNVAMAANPVGIVVVAIGALIGILVAFFTKTEIGKSLWASFTGFLKSALEPVVEAFRTLKTAWDEVMAAFRGGDDGYGALESIFGGEKAKQIADFAAKIGETFRNIKDSFAELKAAFAGEDAGIGALSSLFGEDKARSIANAFETIGNVIQKVREIVEGAMSSAMGSIMEALKTGFDAVVDVGKAFWNVLESLGGALMDLWNVIEPVVMPVLKALGIIIGVVIIGAIVVLAKVIEGAAWVIGKFAEAISWVVSNVFAPLIDAIANVINWVRDRLGEAFSVAKDWIMTAWDAISNGIKWAWENIIKPAWDALEYAAKFGIGLIGTVVLTPLLIAWNLLSEGISWAWNNIIKPAWDALAAAANWLWTTILVPAFDGIKWAWNTLGDAISWAWNNIIKPAWDAIAAGISWLKDAVFTPAVDGIKSVWNALGDGIKWVWDNVINPTWNFIKNGLQALGDFFRSIWNNFIKPAWDALGAGIKYVADNVVMPVFNALQKGLDTLKGWFNTTVEAIGKIWDGIREKTRKPVEFVVNTVYNNGIRKAWNTVAKLVGLEELPEHHLAFARGGVFPGYAPGRDTIRAYSPQLGILDFAPGEWVMRPEVVRGMGGPAAAEALNRAAVMGGVPAVQRMLGQGAAFKKGGEIKPNGGTKDKSDLDLKIARLFEELRPEHGKPYQYGGTGNPSWDCSGIWSGIVQFLNGGNLRGGRIFNTESQFENFGFEQGLTGRVTIGVMRGGGGPNSHMAGTIDGTNIESGGTNGVQIGGAALGSDASMFHLHYTLKEFLGEFISGGAGGGSGFNLGAMVRGLWDSAIHAIGDFPGADQFGEFGKLPGRFAKKLAEAAWDFIKDKVGTFSGSAGVGGNMESWREMAMAAMRRQGFNADDPRQVDAMLKQIMSESSGIPDQAQQIVDVNGTGESAGLGLLQIIPPTFAAYRDPELPDDRRDPWANMNAALRYYRARYGNDLTTMWGQGHGYDRGGVLPPTPNGYSTYYNHTGRPEYVLTHSQWGDVSKLVRTMEKIAPSLDRIARRGPTAMKRVADVLEHTYLTGDFPGAGTDRRGRALIHEDDQLVDLALDLHKTRRDLIDVVHNSVDEIVTAFHGGDWGYGSLTTLLGGNAELARNTVNFAGLLGVAYKEFEEAWHGGDYGYGATAELLGGNYKLAKELVQLTAKVGASYEELEIAWHGGDWGYGATAELLGGNYELAREIVQLTAKVGLAYEELETAYHGGDWGYAGVAELLGGNYDLAKKIVTGVADVGAAVRETKAAIDRGTKGFNEWAGENDKHGRIGRPEEWATHLGSGLAAYLANDALGLLGFDGIIGGTLKDSFVELINRGVDVANAELDKQDVMDDLRFGYIHKDILKPVSLIDDEGRVAKTPEPEKTEPKPEEKPADVAPKPADAVATKPPTAEVTAAATAEKPAETKTPEKDKTAGKTVIKLEGEKMYTAEQVKQMFDDVKKEHKDLQAEVEILKEENKKPVTAGVGGIV